MVVLLQFFIHTDYHASADVTELWFLAVMVLELVGFVVDPDNRLWRFWFLLLYLNLLLVYEVDLHQQGLYLRYFITHHMANVLMWTEFM